MEIDVQKVRSLLASLPRTKPLVRKPFCTVQADSEEELFYWTYLKEKGLIHGEIRRRPGHHPCYVVFAWLSADGADYLDPAGGVSAQMGHMVRLDPAQVAMLVDALLFLGGASTEKRSLARTALHKMGEQLPKSLTDELIRLGAASAVKILQSLGLG